MGSYVSMINGHVDEAGDLFGATDAAIKWLKQPVKDGDNYG